MKKKSKRYKNLLKNFLDFKSTDLKVILELIKKNSTTKFDESIDVSLRIGLKQSKGGDFSLRTVTHLPDGNGKKFKVAVLCESDKIEEAKQSGADIVGSDDLIEVIASGKFNFDKLICTPGMMGKIGKHGKVLGPKGLMPNPKLGTVSTNIKKSVEDINSGLRVFYKSEFMKDLSVYPDKFSITSTQTLCTISRNKEVEYIDTKYFKRDGKSKISVFVDPFKATYLIFKIFLIFFI